MQIKVFTAPHLHEALAKVRQSMGPEALILDRQKSEDGSVWHVHAALDHHNPDPAPATKTSGTIHHPVSQPPPRNKHTDATLERLERIVEGLSHRESSSLRQALADGAEQQAFDHLVKIGLSASHAFDMAGNFAHNKPIANQSMAWGKRIKPEEQRYTLLFSGPSGSGKSTLIAKLAAHYSMKGIRVALLSTDTERMGGLDTLRAYANTLGIPFHPIRKAADADAILHQTQTAQLLLIDTEGWSPQRDASLKRQSDIWAALSQTSGQHRRFLMLPANMDEEDGMQQLKHRATTPTGPVLQMTDIAFSKLDETQKPGKIVNWCIASNLPMSYCSFGPEVPEQMGWLNATALSTLLGKQYRAGSA